MRSRLLALALLLAAPGPAEAARVAVVGGETIHAVRVFLANAGIDVVYMTPRDAELRGFGDAASVVVGRLVPSGPSEALLDRISDHLLGGGGVVLLWDGVSLMFDDFAENYRFRESAQLGWFSGTVGGGVNLVEPSPIVLQESDHDLWVHEVLEEEVQWPAFPQFFFTIDNVDPLLDVVAVYRGDGSPAFPGGSYPAVLGGRVCRGRVAMYPLNFSDILALNGGIRLLINRSINWAQRPPEGMRGPCPPAPDFDGDGVDMPADNCPDDENPDQEDRDGDRLGDVCDVCPDDAGNDRDGDEICAGEDNCPGAANPGQLDTDDDGIGDACDRCPEVFGDDADRDGLCPDEDNCPDVPNEDQRDLDGDEIGDACDPDRDGDGLDDALEEEAGLDPEDADTDDDGVLDGREPRWNEDTDGDGLINGLDPDSDDDGLPDGLEMGVRVLPRDTDHLRGNFVPDADPGTTTNPLEADTDGGGAPDGVEDIVKNGRVDRGEGDPNDPTDDARFLAEDAGPGEPDAGSDPDAGAGRDAGAEGGEDAAADTGDEGGVPDAGGGPRDDVGPDTGDDDPPQRRDTGVHIVWDADTGTVTDRGGQPPVTGCACNERGATWRGPWWGRALVALGLPRR